MKTLQTTGPYRNSTLGMNYDAGRVEAFEDAMADYLMRDAPGVWVEVDSQAYEAATAAHAAMLVEAYGTNQEVVVEVTEPEPEPEPDDGLEDMSLAEIREYAASQNIALTGLRRKQDVIAAIRDA